jgi:hypothetical protein
MTDGYVRVTGPKQWQLVHDASGKIVVRDAGNTVIATARWVDQRAVERAHRAHGIPSEAEWSQIQHAIGGAVREARVFPPDPTLDDGVVERPATDALRTDPQATAAKDTKVGVVGWLVLILVAAAIAAFVLVVVPFLKKHDLMSGGSKANGEACTTDSDCKSGDCYKKTCRGDALKVRGDRCDRDRDCKSKSCSNHTCD